MKIVNVITKNQFIDFFEIKIKYIFMIFLFELLLEKKLKINNIINNKIANNYFFQIINREIINGYELNKLLSYLLSNINNYYKKSNYFFNKKNNVLIIKNLDILYNYRLSNKLPVFYNKFKGSYELYFKNNFIKLFLNLFINIE